MLGNLHEMIKIVNHPFLADLEPKCVWEDSGKFVALGELFEQFGFTEDDSIQHNKVIVVTFRLSSSRSKRTPLI